MCRHLKGSPAAGSQPNGDTGVAGSDLLSAASAFSADPEPIIPVRPPAGIDTRSRCWRVPALSDRSARIVYAQPPGKRPAPRRVAPSVDKRPQAALEPLKGALTSSTAIDAFLALLQAWKLTPARG